MKQSLVGVYAVMREKGISLPEKPADPATLSLSRYLSADTIYLSGMGPNLAGQPEIHGKVPGGMSEADAYQAARNVGLNMLAVLESELGDLNRIRSFIKLLVFVACDDPLFARQHIVANGVSELFIELFGVEIGKSARSAIGVYSLPGDIPVEIEAIVRFD